MHDPSLFTSGALFTQDYLSQGIVGTANYQTVDVAALRSELVRILAGFPHANEPNEATTEGDLVWPILRLLGWNDFLTQQNLSAAGRVDVPDGLLFIDSNAKTSANAHPEEWRRYEFGAAVLESKRWGRALDRAEGRRGADRDTPSTQLLRYLRRIDDLTHGRLRWGILTNGAKWRLYFSGARSTIDDYLELDLARILSLDPDLLDSGATDADRDHWLTVFVTMFSRNAFERADDSAPSFHDSARRDAAFYEERVAKSLSEKVFGTLYPSLGKAVAAAAPVNTPLDDVRQATLILLYRLLFVLYAEDRGLLPVKDRRFDDYALRIARIDVGQRKDAGDAFSAVARNYWHRFADLATMIDKGDHSVGLPPYNGGLFNSDATPLLASISLPDAVMAEAIDILSFEQAGGRRRYINYRDLSVQQLGSIYERLLEFELTRDAEGLVDVRPNIFARKNSGSYYTPDELVLLILDETLAPLINDALEGFKTALAALKPKDSEDYRIAQLQKADPARAITRLKVCDPAMGSGHFLVSLVDRLTNHALDAIEEARALARDLVGLDYESPVSEEIRKVRATIRHNADDAGWSVSEEQLDDPQLVKRMVLKRCVYGADKNPMAVELAKVALWLHTFTVGAPLSFIDHHLAAGDSLFGLWVRDALDKAGKGGSLFLHEPLSNAQRQAVVMRTIESLTDAEVAEAHRSAEMWHDVEAQTGPLDGFVSFMQALEWLDLKDKQDKALVALWLDGRFGEPIPIARGRVAPEGGKARPEEVERFTAIWREARALIDEERFLNWQISFPGVWDNWDGKKREGGFDAIVGNPPWDRFEFEEVPWFEARDKAIALAPSGAKRKAAIKALKEADSSLWVDYQKALSRIAMATKVAKGKLIYSRLNHGKLNLYKLFVERAHALVKPGGMVGLLTPSGIASDLSASRFFREVATGGHLKAFFDFENRRSRYGLEPFFPDVDTRFKFATMVSSPARVFAAADCGFFLQAVSELKNPEQGFQISADDFARVNPNTGTAPIFRTRRDMRLTTAIYDRVPVLVNKSTGSAVSVWPIRYSQTINMTSDSHLFRTRSELEISEGAWQIGGNRWQSKEGEWVPLYEGKMVQSFDHRAAGIVVNPENLNRPAQPLSATAQQSADPSWLARPQFWIQPPPGLASAKYALGFKDVTAPTNARTMIAAIIPSGAAGNTFPLIELYPDEDITDPAKLCLFAANLNATVFDFVARQKVQGQHLNWFIVEQLPIIPLEVYTRAFGDKTAADIVIEAVLELTYTAHDMAPFAHEMQHTDSAGQVLPPFVWSEERRLHLRAKLDALYFILYGVFDPADPKQSHDDICYIYSTFPIAERQDRAAHGNQFRSRDLALAYINVLMAGQPDIMVGG